MIAIITLTMIGFLLFVVALLSLHTFLLTKNITSCKAHYKLYEF